jgi:hypothetical protein
VEQKITPHRVIWMSKTEMDLTKFQKGKKMKVELSWDDFCLTENEKEQLIKSVRSNLVYSSEDIKSYGDISRNKNLVTEFIFVHNKEEEEYFVKKINLPHSSYQDENGMVLNFSHPSS